ncbi:hypothetical protein ACHAQJ_009707 [Trichoderma viride]
MIDPGSEVQWVTRPDNGPENVDVAIKSFHEAFLEYWLLNPRKGAQLLLAWHSQITNDRDDLAKLLTYETSKPLTEL